MTMKWFLGCSISILLFIAVGCGPPEPPPEPTPDVQAKMQAEAAMNEWFTDIRYAYGLVDEASDTISKKLVDAEAENNDYSEVAKLVAYFNEPGGLKERLDGKLKLLNDKKAKLDKNAEKDFALFKNLGDLTNIYSKLITLVTTLPENSSTFSNGIQGLNSQFSAIERLLMKTFVQSDADLDQKRSMENPEFKSDRRVFDSIPTPGPIAPEPEATPTVIENTPTPTQGPVKVWRDADGTVHMGQEPPEDVDTRDLKGKISQGYYTEETMDSEETEEAESDASLIWTDAEGNIHMGQKAPEGATTKKAEEIELMIQE